MENIIKFKDGYIAQDKDGDTHWHEKPISLSYRKNEWLNEGKCHYINENSIEFHIPKNCEWHNFYVQIKDGKMYPVYTNKNLTDLVGLKIEIEALKSTIDKLSLEINSLKTKQTEIIFNSLRV